VNQIKTLIISNEMSKANKELKWDSSDTTNKKHRQYPFTVTLEKFEDMQRI